MANFQFNGAIMNFNGITFGVTSFSEDAGSRAEIDVTTSADTVRRSIIGLKSVPTLNFGFIYNDERSTLDAALVGCTAANMTLSVTKDCVASNLIGPDAQYYLMGYNIAGDIDGAIVGTIDFLKS
jgi:hypothetical protein